MPKTSVVLEFKASTAKARQSLRRFQGQFRELGGSVGSFNRPFNKTNALLSRFVGYMGAYVTVRRFSQSLSGAAKAGLAFNDQMEVARFGVAGIIKATDKTGAFEDYNKALEAAAGLLEDIKRIAPQTAGTLQGLTKGMQTLIGPAREAGVEMEKIPDLTLKISQALAALGVKENEISQEARALFSGDQNDRQNRLNAILRVTKAEIEAAKATGTVYELLSDRLEGFSQSGVAVMGTLSGLKSNLKDAFDIAAGEGFEGLSESMKDLLETMQEMVKTEGFKAFLKDISTIMESMVDSTTVVARNYDKIKDFFSNYTPIGIGVRAVASVASAAGSLSVPAEDMARRGTSFARPPASSSSGGGSNSSGVARSGFGEETDSIEELSKAYQTMRRSLLQDLDLMDAKKEDVFTSSVVRMATEREEAEIFLKNQLSKIDELAEAEEERDKLKEFAAQAHEARISEISELEAQHRIEIAEAEANQKKQLQLDYLQATSSMLGSAAQAAQLFGQKGFLAWKAFAVAQTTVSTAAAVMTQLSSGDPYSAWIRAAAAAATGAVQLATIIAAKPQGFETGGIPAAGERTIRVNENGQEGIVNAQGLRAIGPEGLAMINAGMVNAGILASMIPSGIASRIPSGTGGSEGTVSQGSGSVTIVLVDSRAEAEKYTDAKIINVVRNNRIEIGLET